jgi:hypothetical protein
MENIWNEEMKEAKAKKRTIYHPPLPRKRQRCTHYRGRSGKVTQFTEEQIMLEKMRSFKNLTILRGE